MMNFVMNRLQCTASKTKASSSSSNNNTKNETFFDLLENLIVCKFDKASFHFLRKPVILPCGYTVCKECVQDSILRFGFVKCDYLKCTLKHQITSASDLSANKAVDDILEGNIKYLAEFYIEELKALIECRISPVPTKNDVDLVFRKAEYDIKFRMKNIRTELDKIETGMLTLVKKSRSSYYNDQKKLLKNKEQSTLKLIDLTQSLLKQQSTSNVMLKAYTSKCYSCIKEITGLTFKVKETLQNVKFEMSKWQPTKLNVGNLEIPNVHFSNRDSVLISKEVSNVNYYLQNMQLLPKVIFQEYQEFDKNNFAYSEKCFSLIKDLPTLTGETKILSQQYGICYDNIENIYLCDFNRSCVLIVDKEFTKIKKIISKNKMDEEEKKSETTFAMNKVRPLNFRYIQTLFI